MGGEGPPDGQEAVKILVRAMRADCHSQRRPVGQLQGCMGVGQHGAGDGLGSRRSRRRHADAVGKIGDSGAGISGGFEFPLDRPSAAPPRPPPPCTPA